MLKAVPVVALALVASACDAPTELNENPNAPTDVPARFLLTQGTQQAVDMLLGSGLNLDYGELLVQHIAEIQYAEEDVYVYRSPTTNSRFRTFYAGPLIDFQRMIDKGEAEGNPSVQGVGMIMKSWTFHNMTDLWGDLPYTQALQGEAEESVITPTYDSQADIYPMLLADLDAGGAMLTSNAGFGNADLIYNDDMSKWSKFANSLRLRIAMRMSDVAPGAAQAAFESALADGVFESSADNAVLMYLESAPNRHPWNETFRSRPGDRRVSATIIDTLKSLNDPRLEVYAQPLESGEYVGMPNGLEEHDFGLTDASEIGTYFLAAAQPAVLMSYSEVLFLKAEAAAKGWAVPGGTAASFYAEAIATNMRRFGIAEVEITAYLAQPEVQYSAENLAVQKWISLFGQGLEAFAEVRRLDLPALTPGADARLDELPTRYPYPDSERTFNNANLEAAIAAQGTDGGHTGRLWWDVD